MTGKTASAIFKAALCPASALLLLCACESSGPIQDDTTSQTAIGSRSGANIAKTSYGDEETATMKKVADLYLNEILTGMKDRNYKLFIKNFTDEMKIDITEKNFGVMVDEFNKKKGPYISRQYLGDLNQGFFKIFIWRAQFDIPKDFVAEAKKLGKDPKTLIHSDTLIRLEMAKVGSSYVVMGIYFQ